MAEVSALRLIIDIGGTFSEQITWSVDDVPVPFPPGTEAEAKVRPTLYDEDVLIWFKTSPGAGRA